MNWPEFKINKAAKGGKNYPVGLLELASPPKEIYWRGELRDTLLKPTLAIVGSRRMTRYGASVIEKIVSHLTLNNITTVSGYMYGVDTEVHAQTVGHGGQTIAVLGSGINQPYPPENNKLYTKILQTGGAVISELQPETKPKLWTFPERNRIIAALGTIGLLVIEASEKSGSMITVNYARKLKKKIYAIPGPINSSVSEGTNYLIKRGIATMVTDPEDLFQSTKKNTQKAETSPKLEGLDKEIYDRLRDEALSLDELAMVLKKDIVVLSTQVSMLALQGLISEAGGKYFVV